MLFIYLFIKLSIVKILDSSLLTFLEKLVKLRKTVTIDVNSCQISDPGQCRGLKIQENSLFAFGMRKHRIVGIDKLNGGSLKPLIADIEQYDPEIQVN